jgi:hypothetical protein
MKQNYVAIEPKCPAREYPARAKLLRLKRRVNDAIKGRSFHICKEIGYGLCGDILTRLVIWHHNPRDALTEAAQEVGFLQPVDVILVENTAVFISDRLQRFQIEQHQPLGHFKTPDKYLTPNWWADFRKCHLG